MEGKSLLVGGAFGALLLGGIMGVKKLTEKVPIPANEIKTFNPIADGSTHPFYETWSKIPRSRESLTSMCVLAHKAARRVAAGRNNINDLDCRERLLLKLGQTDNAIEEFLVQYPSTCIKALNLGITLDTDSQGHAIIFDPFAGQTNLTRAEQNAQAEIQRSIRKNKPLLYNAAREVAQMIIKYLLLDRDTAELSAKLIKGEYKADDLTEEQLKCLIASIHKGIAGCWEEFDELWDNSTALAATRL